MILSSGVDSPCWASLPSDALHMVFASSPLCGDARAWAMGAAACRAWRAALQTFQPDSLIVSHDSAASMREAALLVHWFATHPPTRLQHLVLPTDCPTHGVLAVLINAIPHRALRSLRMTIRIDQFVRQHYSQLPSFTGLTSLHLTLHSSFLFDGTLHKRLRLLSATLQLRRLQLRTFRSITGAATLSQCTQLSELEVFGSAAKRVLPAAPAASLRHLVLHDAHGAENHCVSALAALTALRCLALRGKLSRLLLPAGPLPELRALFLEDADIEQLFYGPAKLYSQLRVLHLAGASAVGILETVIWPGREEIEKIRCEWDSYRLLGVAMRYSLVDVMLRPGLEEGRRCLICPFDEKGAAAELTVEHVLTQQHIQQLEDFKQFRHTYKQKIGWPLMLCSELGFRMDAAPASDPDVPPELGPLQAWLDPHWRTLHAALVAVENTRSWAGLTPLVSAALSVEAEAERAGQVLGSCHPAVRQFLDGIGLDWGFALGAAYTRERMLWYFAMQGAPGAKLSDRLLEFGIACPKLRRAPCAAASESGRCEPSKQEQWAQQAAAAVAGWVPAGASIVTASFEGWVRMTRALGL